MRLSQSGSSGCDSGCVSSMAPAAVHSAAATDSSLLPSLLREPEPTTCSPAHHLGSQASRSRRRRRDPLVPARSRPCPRAARRT